MAAQERSASLHCWDAPHKGSLGSTAGGRCWNATLLGKTIWFPAGRSPFLEAGADRVPQSGQRPRPQQLDKVQRSASSQELAP